MLLSTAEAAVRLGISPRRIQRLIKDTRLPAQRIGRSYVVDEADLARLERQPVGRPKGQGRKKKQ
jgi:excisionase family DNA binding protein